MAGTAARRRERCADTGGEGGQTQSGCTESFSEDDKEVQNIFTINRPRVVDS